VFWGWKFYNRETGRQTYCEFSIISDEQQVIRNRQANTDRE